MNLWQNGDCAHWKRAAHSNRRFTVNYTTHQPVDQPDSEMLKRLLVDDNAADSEPFRRIFDAPENDRKSAVTVPR